MAGKTKRYTSDPIDVTYEARRCIHAAECVRGLAAVFDTAQRPWIQPANAGPDAVADVVTRCPTGALHFERNDGGAAEAVPTTNRIVVTAGGPLHVRGDVKLVIGDETVTDTRMALCRCGRSANKPFCDNAHKASGFSADGLFTTGTTAADYASEPLTITAFPNGPLGLRGQFELISADGATVFQGTKVTLCRCGGSSNKPFCDNTHRKINFTTEAAE